jgi:hypothetical protein
LRPVPPILPAKTAIFYDNIPQESKPMAGIALRCRKLRSDSETTREFP